MYEVSQRYSDNIAKTITFTGIYGTITLNDGTVSELNDEVISEGQLSILSKMNSSGEFKSGGVYPSEMSLSLQNFEGNTKNLEGAEIALAFRLYTDGTFGDYDEVPLGVFDVDGSTIKRRAQRVSFKALDRLVQFDRPTEEKTGTLYELLCYACDVCGVSLEMTQAEFEELPNSGLSVTLNTARVQTWRDYLGYVGTVTSTFAKATRTGGLVLKRIICEKTEGGVIIPVREINGDIRFSTEFSDDTTRVTRLIMRRNGKELRSTTKWTTTIENRAYITLELAENPLFSELSDGEVSTALNDALSPVANCLNRTFKASFPGDPALEIGDYVRLRGGDIDTSRGYGTGMITSMTWKYHGASTIECDMPSSVASSGASAASEESDSDGRVQPKSQLEKRVDALEKALAELGIDTAKYLKTTDNAATAQTYAQGLVVLNEQGQVLLQTVNTTGSGGVLQLDFSGIKLNPGMPYSVEIKDGNIFLGDVTTRIELTPTYITLQNGNNAKLHLYQDGIIINTPNTNLRVDADGLYINENKGTAMSMRTFGNGFKIVAPGNTSLEVTSDGLYVNGSKIG